MLALLFSFVPTFCMARAVDRGGNIFVIGSDGSETQITSSGADSQPDLSFDGTKVVFVREASLNARELWVANTKGTPSARRLVATPLEINGRRFDQLFSPKFSPDGTVVYFLIPYAGTTEAIIRVDVTKPDPQFVLAAMNFLVLQAGKYRGDLIVQVRKAKLGSGYYEWYWIVTPDGKELGVVGQGESDMALFMTEQE